MIRASWMLALCSAGCSGGAGSSHDEATDTHSPDHENSGQGANVDQGCSRATQITARPAPRLLFSAAEFEALAERARAGDADWKALSAQCDEYGTGEIHPPSGAPYPGFPNIGQGYQGDSYYAPMHTLGMCYRVAAEFDPEQAARYAATGTKLLEAMSTPADSGGFQPSTNSGYGIRHYGVAMAIGYDWLYPALSDGVRKRVIDALNTWIDWYDTSGFLRDQPISNYFVGYFQAKLFTALATEGENPKAASYFQDIEHELWPDKVKPQLEKVLAGGGWPEGWGYGPRAVRGLAEILYSVGTARSLAWAKEVPLIEDQARYIAQFAWPSLKRMDDQGTVRAGIALKPSAALTSALARMLRSMKNDYAGSAASLAREIVSATDDDREVWERFALALPEDLQASYQDEPLSYLAEGPGHVAMRSSWAKDAVWASVAAGTYINAPDSGEQMFNSGSLSIVVGNQPLLINPTGWIPNTANTEGENFVYSDTWTEGTRQLYNTFFVDDPSNPYNPGQSSAGPDVSRAHVSRYEEGVRYVHMRGDHIEDQYGTDSKPVEQFTRDVVFVRPATVLLFDRTRIKREGADQWIAFHTPVAPEEVSTTEGQQRFDISQAGERVGSIRMHLPAEAPVTTVPLPGGSVRLEEHAPSPETDQQWLSVVSAQSEIPEQTLLSVEQGNVIAGDLKGVHLHSTEDEVVVFSSAQDKKPLESASYVIEPSAQSHHLIVDMADLGDGYSVTTVPTEAGLEIAVEPGGVHELSSQGNLSFDVSATGEVIAVQPPPDPESTKKGTSGTPGETGETSEPDDPLCW